MEMKKRLIDANVMRQDWLENGENEYVYDANAVLDSIDAQPTVDAVEVVHGRWENITGGMIILGDCSKCKVRQPVIGTNYCKNCGAKMDGGDEDG